MQGIASLDVFSLGVILLQIATGCPTQLDVPIKFRCTTTSDDFFIGAPHFGYCLEGLVNDKYVSQTVKL